MKRNICNICIVSILGLLSCGSVNNLLNKKMDASTQAVKGNNSINGQWRLNYITGVRIAFDGLYPTSKPYMVVDSANLHVNGSTGCNSFTGPFVLKGDSLLFKNLATTMKMCVDGAKGEAVFLATMEKITNYRVVGDTLWLKFKNINAMRFVRDSTVKQ